MAEKTEEPTPKKLQDARKQGNIALSRDVGAAATFVVGTTIAMLMATRIGAAFDSLYRLVIATIPRLPGDRLVEVYAAPTREAVVAIVMGAGPIWAAIVL